MSLFPNLEPQEERSSGPLADRMRPRTLEAFIGQRHLLAPGKPLRTQLERDELSSMIFWGPPGCGKTTLARIIALRTQSDFVPFSAVMSGIKEVKAVMEEAARARRLGRRTLLFVDEIHRFNKAQQDAFLPHVEKGNVILIGATTENPSFEIIMALLSRSRVYRLYPLETEEIVLLLQRAWKDRECGLGKLEIDIPPDFLGQIAAFANGDARVAYNALEAVVQGTEPVEGKIRITQATVEAALQRKTLLYDKAGEEHFNIISALHKSLRNSDADAALHWLARMLEAGEDPLYIARRLVRFASEDVGLADPQALPLTIAAMQAVDFIGMPEGALALAEAAIYLALAPKSNSVYRAYGAAQQDVATTLNEPVPLHLRNAPTSLMKKEGYGAGYEYAHNLEEKVSAMPCLPPGLEGRRYYQPTGEGLEQRFQKRLEEIRERKRRAGEKG
ncbi:MAG: replication-associated recombination protein A [Acidobacteria bacterium]|nr:replication-associated recombination protein A [Acidobacteriota bacterium]